MKNIPGGRNTECRMSEGGENLECSQNGMEAHGPGAEQVQARAPEKRPRGD